MPTYKLSTGDLFEINLIGNGKERITYLNANGEQIKSIEIKAVEIYPEYFRNIFPPLKKINNVELEIATNYARTYGIYEINSKRIMNMLFDIDENGIEQLRCRCYQELERGKIIAFGSNKYETKNQLDQLIKSFRILLNKFNRIK